MRGYASVISVVSRRWDRKGEEGGDLAQQQYLVNLLVDAGVNVSKAAAPPSDDHIKPEAY